MKLPKNHKKQFIFTDLGDMAGKPEAVSLEPEIVTKKGKIPNR